MAPSASYETRLWRESRVPHGRPHTGIGSGFMKPDFAKSRRLLKMNDPFRSTLLIQFWYQMWGSSKISIFIKTFNQELELLHEITDSTGDNWTKVSLPIKSISLDTAQIILEATYYSNQALVAIDDIGLSIHCVANNALSGQSKETIFHHCPSGFSCGNGNCIPWKKRCDFTKDCVNGIDEKICPAKCDFESDDCGWRETRHFDYFDWVRDSNSNVEPEYLSQTPPQDHTTNSTEGHFMFIQKKDSNFTQIAELRSIITTDQQWERAVILLHIKNERAPTVLWSTYFNQGNQWLKGFIQLDRLRHPFQLSVNKFNMGYYEGVAALDDIVFENCSLPSAVPSCRGPDLFWCKDTKACISTLLVCDLTDDCGDGSDEINCMPLFSSDASVPLCSSDASVPLCSSDASVPLCSSNASGTQCFSDASVRL
ncbi:unnamed protein product [Ranitomeya imitator]|uniref:MAM domain-containing protein n=1 Tax=Ranitomeya imitator TaxID=111125 RepID=A0ABN9M9B5_9NEOB|nr:unnamed protein product [Ranitomeya imitator]